MQKKDYTNYSAEELLEDDFFLKSLSNPTPESQFFWEELKNGDEVLAKEIMIASGILRSIPYRKRTFSSDDKDLLWKQICQTNNKKR